MDDQQKQDVEQKPYEVSFLVASEEQAGDVARLLAQHTMEVARESPLKKINLSYPLQRATQAVFGFFHVFSRPADIKLLEKDLKSNQQVLRSLIISLPKEKAGEARAEERHPRTPAKREVAYKELRANALSNEAIEKKIEEILQ